ncbi:unnamed protein product [Vicia faba]|uniref:3-hydroxyisobutyryl-CoA hydrolase n=1 Tax=Vicia faba TaxID=3906 RepID=A0AAV0YW32_VICFA|nr:unnamed protein product [Vicia faba]
MQSTLKALVGKLEFKSMLKEKIHIEKLMIILHPYFKVSKLLEIFHDDEENSDVKLVIVKGNGRAFCAGGDVAAVVHEATEGDWSKPQVSILNGIVMGGGAGASMHGRFRVVTENTVFAMPETALGLFPDVGAAYFLSRLAGFFGEYVGLTGARLDGAEMLACGLATHFVPSSKLSVYHRMDLINKCFSRKTVEEILSCLETEATSKADSWISTTLETLKKSSSTSLKVFLRLIREVRLVGVGECLVREYRIVCHILQGHHSKDFFEGCRAILIDKDRKPKWEPSKLELVSDGDVDSYFSKLDDAEGWKDLELPNGFKNLPAHAISKL